MIEIKDLQVKYDDFIAIDDINIRVEEGEFFTLLGPSGCGKSTTLRAIAGFNKVSQGQILLDEKDITNAPVEKRGLGMVFQSYALFPTMTVFDNIAYGLQVENLPKQQIKDRVEELAQLVELYPEQLKRNVSELSGGQQQRVAIARALAKKPKIILFDEPLSNLDAKLRKQLRSELKRIQRETKMTAIYVTHDQEEALEMSDKIAVFNQGKIEQIGTAKEIYNESATEFVCNFIGSANRISDEIIEHLNQQLPTPLSLKDHHYIRLEKIKLAQKEAVPSTLLELPVSIKDSTFQGVFTTYQCQFGNSMISVMDKEDGSNGFQAGDTITLYINPKTILSYEVK